jgi:hypothetical protein
MFREMQGFFDSVFRDRDPSVQIVQVGLDGSWGERAPRVLSYGGVAGNQNEWTALDPLWLEVLRTHGLTEFHMVDAMNFRNAFQPWGEDRFQRRDALLQSLVDVIKTSGLKAVVTAAEEGLLSNKAKAKKKREVFEDVVRQLVKVLPQADVMFAFLCDREQDLSREVLVWLEKLQIKDPSIVSRIAGVCYMKRQTVLQLQAADLIAYLYREEVERHRHEPHKERNPLLERLSGDTVKTRFILKTEFLS